jgi:parallel beta-helix repeat protein
LLSTSLEIAPMLSFFRRRFKKPVRITASRRLSFDWLEDRDQPATFSVVNLNDIGAGSLRRAIHLANASPGPDVIEFDIAGTIHLAQALPDITDAVTIDGTTAPGFTSAPVVEVDFHRFTGLHLTRTATSSQLISLGIVNSSTAGVWLDTVTDVNVVGNYVGLGLDGITANGNNDGIYVSGAGMNLIGGETAADRNVISGNRRHGVYVVGSHGNRIMGNYIGTDATGAIDRGNAGSGVLAERSNYNWIGQNDPVSGVDYYDTSSITTMPVNGWQGIRGADDAGEYLMVGTSGSDGLLFEGTIEGVGDAYPVIYPNAYNTSIYGPDNLGNGNIRLVGVYKNPDFATAPVEVNGMIWEGTTADLAASPQNASQYRTINYPGAKYNYLHSTAGGLIVGNYDNPTDHGTNGLPFGPGHAFIYDIATDTFLTDVVYPAALSNTAYGIWYNGGTSYTICGGYSLDAVNNFDDQNRPIGTAYLVDYDTATGLFTNWTSFSAPQGTNYITHFEGISSVEKGVYTLNADSVQTGTGDPVQGSWVTVRRNADGSFGRAAYVSLAYPTSGGGTETVSSNSVYGNQIVGIAGSGGTFICIQATVNVEFQLSNVISGNGANGITLNASNGNVIAMNSIGTDVTGTHDLGNDFNGILITAGSANNWIGGEATGGNDPTNAVFVRPPQGNLISGNDAYGVAINKQATANQLSGNFIGTDAAGMHELGNGLDGVWINGASGNTLLGCTFQQDPFVFYNVISGNGGNGLRVTNSNDTKIQANFFGIGADNNAALGNNLNGVVIEGSSTRTTMGGPIPLGNVVAANDQNGIVVRGTASEFTSYNTFCGLAAFSLNPHLGNGLDGMLITSTGGVILIRTNVITRNGDDGIEVSGNATGVRIVGNIIGLNTSGFLPMGNNDNGIEIGGNANGIVVGGPQPTFNVIPRNAIGDNGGNGVAVVGAARNTTINHSYIGTDITGAAARGNHGDGVSLAPGTTGTTVGSTDPSLYVVISGNHGNGIRMNGTRNNQVIGALIGTDANGTNAIANDQNGVYISNSLNNVIGRPTPANGVSSAAANLIANSGAHGVYIESGTGNGVRENSIFNNHELGLDLAAGANLNPTAPVISSVGVFPLGTSIAGTLTSRANTDFTLEFFASTANDGSGQSFLGSLRVRTNSSGVATFTFVGPVLPTGYDVITSTATDPANNTSEFSVGVTII